MSVGRHSPRNLPWTSGYYRGTILWTYFAGCCFGLSLSKADPPTLGSIAPAALHSKAESFANWALDRETKAMAERLMPAAGEAGVVTRREGPIRLPVFLIKFDDTPKYLVEDEALIRQARERFFGEVSADNKPIASVNRYISDLFRDAITFGTKNKDDFFAWVEIPGKAEDYLVQYGTMTVLRRSFFLELIKATRKLKLDFNPYDNDAIEGDGPSAEEDQSAHGAGPPHDDNEVDGMIILLPIGNGQRGAARPFVHAYRSWIEWTGQSGLISGTAQTPEPRLETHDHFLLSSYVCMSLFEKNPPSQQEVADSHNSQGGSIALFDLGMPIHEILHLFAIPDLYGTRGPTAGVGSWCVMSYGMYGAAQKTTDLPLKTTPCWPCAWVRHFLRTDADIARSYKWPADGASFQDEVTLAPPLSRAGLSYVRLDLPKSHHLLGSFDPEKTFDRYLLVEFRGPSLAAAERFDWDDGLPSGGGFLIWDINERVGQVVENDEHRAILNKFWPCVYQNESSGYGWQNNDPSRPLVGLWRPNDSTRNPEPSNLDNNEMMAASHYWVKRDSVFRHPTGLILDQFNTQRRSFHFQYPGQRTFAGARPSASPAPSLQELISERQMATSGTPAVSPPVSTESVNVTVSKSSAPTTALEQTANGTTQALQRAYPEIEIAVAMDRNSGEPLAVGNLPVRTKSSAALNADISGQLKLLPKGKLAAEFQWGDFQAAKAGSVKERVMSGVSHRTVAVNGEKVPIFDSPVVITINKEKTDTKEGDRTTASYHLGCCATDLSNLAVPRKGQKGGEELTREEVLTFLRTRLGRTLKESTQWELQLGIDSGKTVWRCRIPTVPGRAPTRVDIDATRPSDADKSGLKIVKIF